MKLDEIAKLAGVSKTTASYVINGKAKKYRVSDSTIERVMAIVNKYNFQPNAIAAGLRAGKTNSIGLIIPDLENISYTRIANYLEYNIRQAGYQLLISCSEDNLEIEKQCIFHLKQRHVDAIVVSSSLISDGSFYDDWDNNHTPILALDRPLPIEKFRSILGSDKADSESLAIQFSEFVSDNIVYVGALPSMSVSQYREQGFKSGIKGIKNEVTYLYAKDYSRDSAKELFNQWLNIHPIPLSLFVTSFSLLQGVIDAILSKDGAIPSQMIMATFGDSELLDFLPCRVLSLAQNHKRIAEITVETLMASLNEQQCYQPGYTEVNRNLNYRGRFNQRNR